MNRFLTALVILILALVQLAHATISIDLVTVANPGNAADGSGFGAVSYEYNIGKYEVSLLQYATFLNAVAKTDTYSLWNGSINNAYIAGISRSGSSGSFTYSVTGDGNRPVTLASWFDAARFTNWLSNGQPIGGQVAGITETGAYTLNGATSGIITKNADATFWIPSENEWYKAAYYDPSLNSGAGGYWLYPTRSNSGPGNVVGSSPNQANYYNGVYSVTQSGSFNSSQNHLTVGGAFTASGSAYGTFDQGGNVGEWNDAVIGSQRGYRGGGLFAGANELRSSGRFSWDPTLEFTSVGFRVAAAVPEPNGIVAAILSAGTLLVWHRKRRAAQKTIAGSTFSSQTRPFRTWN